MMRGAIGVLSAAVSLASGTSLGSPIIVGSKIFTESYILGEIAAQVIESSHSAAVDRKLGLGSTGMLFESLKGGEIDVYPDYTGTLAETLLKDPKLKSIEELRAALSSLGLTISGPLGFSNTYTLAVKRSFAEKHGLHSMSDLRALGPRIRAAFSYEFMDRKDGYAGMVERYGFAFDPRGVSRMEHTLVYQAVADDAVDVIEVYSTDANIRKFDLRTLDDDLHYFPPYQAVWVARKSFAENHAEEWRNLLKLEGKMDAGRMLAMNAAADIDKMDSATIAADFLGRPRAKSRGMTEQILLRTREHVRLVAIALLFSVLIGIPLGIVAAQSRFTGQMILLGSAVVQTIPALALLCFLIPVFGVGLKPAVVALCLYSLLPVVLNTFTGIGAIDRKHLENARAFGLNRAQILTRVVLPLASPTILAGLKNATIVSVGTATLAALIGAGGYGSLIISGLSLNDIPTTLAGAVPAAAMALLAHGAFEVLAKRVVPKGLRNPGRF